MDIAIVTGAASGLGLAIARRLIATGMRVYGLGGNYSDTPFSHPDFVPTPCNLADAEAVKERLESILEKEGSVYAVINNAKVYPQHPLEECSVGDLETVMRVNLLSPVVIAQTAMESLKKLGGYIVNIGATTAEDARGGPMGAATAGGLYFMGEALFEDLRDHGVKVTTVFPQANRFRPQGGPEPQKVNPQSVIDVEMVAQVVGEIVANRNGNLITEVVIRPQRRVERPVPPPQIVPYPKPEPLPMPEIVDDEDDDELEEFEKALIRHGGKPDASAQKDGGEDDSGGKSRRKRRGRRGGRNRRRDDQDGADKDSGKPEESAKDEAEKPKGEAPQQPEKSEKPPRKRGRGRGKGKGQPAEDQQPAKQENAPPEERSEPQEKPAQKPAPAEEAPAPLTPVVDHQPVTELQPSEDAGRSNRRKRKRRNRGREAFPQIRKLENEGEGAAAQPGPLSTPGEKPAGGGLKTAGKPKPKQEVPAKKAELTPGPLEEPKAEKEPVPVEKKAGTKKSATKKSAGKKAAAKKSTTKKAPAKKATNKKTATKKAAAKKAATKKSATKKAATKKSAAKKAARKKTAAKKAADSE